MNNRIHLFTGLNWTMKLSRQIGVDRFRLALYLIRQARHVRSVNI